MANGCSQRHGIGTNERTVKSYQKYMSLIAPSKQWFGGHTGMRKIVLPPVNILSSDVGSENISVVNRENCFWLLALERLLLATSELPRTIFRLVKPRSLVLCN